jgi:tRNA threonylcarbamoyladenosine biosynthesis protein TsaB
VGDGALRYADAFSGLSHVEPASVGTAYPSAAALVELAQPRVQREEFVQPWEVEPLYLRQADADPGWDRRLVPQRTDGAGS